MDGARSKVSRLRPVDGGDGHDADLARTIAEAPTDARHVEAFARAYGRQFRYVHTRREWLYYDAPIWRVDAGDMRIHQAAIAFARHRQQAALQADSKAKARAVKFAIEAEKKRMIDAHVALAQHLPPFSDDGQQWDADPWLLACPNGVIDLRTGTLRAGKPTDRLTLCAGAPFDERAECPRWLQALAEIFPDEGVRQYVHRVIGYTATGDTSEQVFFMNVGSGANGKSLVTATIASVLGTYAMHLPFSTFLLYQHSHVPDDLAGLPGRRFVPAMETTEGMRLDEARLKALTGGDRLRVRHLFARWFEFNPMAKFFLNVNHKPVVRDDSQGFWRRVRIVPFVTSFDESRADKHLAETLRDEASGILRWIVEGCRQWQRYGLRTPEAVVSATAEYEADSDVLGDFIREACDVEPAIQVGARDLYAAYRQWAKQHGVNPDDVSEQMFGRLMGRRFAKRRTREGAVYVGIGRRW